MKLCRMIFVLLILMIMAACSAIPYPDCNKNFPPECRLMQIADKFGVCLRDVGNGLIIANGIAIGRNAYTVQEAVNEIEGIIELLNRDILETEFRDHVLSQLKQYPGLLEVTMIYMHEFNMPRVLDKESRVIIQTYLRNKVLPILNAYLIQ